MKRYLMLWTVMAALVIAAPFARAQEEDEGTQPPAGSLTVLSRPANASYKLVGEQTFVGRTPATLQRGLAGRFEVQGFGPGYETWKKSMTLDGVTPDTVWMSLRRKSALLGAARSVVLPGWGQFYCERPARGWAFALSEGVTGIVALVSWRNEQRREDDLSAAEARNHLFNNAASRTQVTNAQSSLEDAQQFTDQSVRVMIGIAALSVIEALVLGPPRPADGASLDVKDQSPDLGARPSVSLLRIRF